MHRTLYVYHLFNKYTEVSLMMQKLAPVHLFGTSESRLDGRITDNLISINDFTVLCRDSGYPLHTGLALYVHKSMENNVRRRLDLETEAIECIWVKIKDSKTKAKTEHLSDAQTTTRKQNISSVTPNLASEKEEGVPMQSLHSDNCARGRSNMIRISISCSLTKKRPSIEM